MTSSPPPPTSPSKISGQVVKMAEEGREERSGKRVLVRRKQLMAQKGERKKRGSGKRKIRE